MAGDRGLGIQDPPRDDSRETLGEAGRLGVKIKMVTGDRVEIASEIAAMVGMGSRILGADALRDGDGRRQEDSARRVEEADGFAQVVPEDKYRIVEMLQGLGHIVGMTGDGVNDVPALERADAGIAVSGATDAARAAADIVLLAPGLSTIIDAIHRAREVFQRMKNYAIYRITETIRVVLFVTVSSSFRLLPGHADPGRAPCDSERRGHPVDRLRPGPGLLPAGALGPEGHPGHRNGAGHGWTGGVLWVPVARARTPRFERR